MGCKASTAGWGSLHDVLRCSEVSKKWGSLQVFRWLLIRPVFGGLSAHNRVIAMHPQRLVRFSVGWRLIRLSIGLRLSRFSIDWRLNRLSSGRWLIRFQIGRRLIRLEGAPGYQQFFRLAAYPPGV